MTTRDALSVALALRLYRSRRLTVAELDRLVSGAGRSER